MLLPYLEEFVQCVKRWYPSLVQKEPPAREIYSALSQVSKPIGSLACMAGSSNHHWTESTPFSRAASGSFFPPGASLRKAPCVRSIAVAFGQLLKAKNEVQHQHLYETKGRDYERTCCKRP